jgi:dipeptidyl aminopeptidase/acylaminoacyl peptidase
VRGARRQRHVLRAGDALAQSFGDRQSNQLPGPTNNITIEMHEGTNMNAFPSPDGTNMVLSLQGGLWIMPASGGTATKITPWDVESTQPAWSPDGQWIAFQNYSTDANYAIWVVKSDGSQLHALTSGPFDDREPSWYPDSSKVIFSSDRSDDKQYKIWSVTLGGALQQLTTGTGAESNPVVSPDGTKIAFVNNGNTIFTMPANLSAAPTQFGSGNYPQFTPNSQGLVFQNTAGNLVVNGNEVTSGERSVPIPGGVWGPNKFVYTGTGKILRGIPAAAASKPSRLAPRRFFVDRSSHRYRLDRASAPPRRSPLRASTAR